MQYIIWKGGIRHSGLGYVEMKDMRGLKGPKRNDAIQFCILFDPQIRSFHIP